MIYFFADDHYGVHPGKNIFEHLPESWHTRIRFFENDLQLLEQGELPADCELLILNMIGETCGQPHPGMGAKQAIRKWISAGRPLLLLHGSSAAFWQWDWWRILPGYRWVRGGDPDEVEPSNHPVRPYTVTVSKTRHPLTEILEDMILPEDEIYINLEQVCPAVTLMETHLEEGTFPQCAAVITPFGGRMINFLPGHKQEVTGNLALIRNIVRLIEFLIR